MINPDEMQKLIDELRYGIEDLAVKCRRLDRLMRDVPAPHETPAPDNLVLPYWKSR